jgi:hypothetical protein
MKLIWHDRGTVCGWGFIGILSVSIVNELQGRVVAALERWKRAHDE